MLRVKPGLHLNRRVTERVDFLTLASLPDWGVESWDLTPTPLHPRTLKPQVSLNSLDLQKGTTLP